MTDQNLLFSPDLTLNLLSKSSPSQLEPFQLKRSRTQPIPETFYSSSLQQQQQKLSSSHNNNNSLNSNNVKQPSNLSHVPCKFYKQGTCTAGANCTFSHSSDLSSESAVCKYFVKGNCKFGTKCALLHTMSPYGTSSGKTTSTTNGNRFMIPPPVPLSLTGRRKTDQMMAYSSSNQTNLDHRSFLHDDPFAYSAPAVSLFHQFSSEQLWRNQSPRSATNMIPNDFIGLRSSPRESSDHILGSSPFNSNHRLSSSVRSSSFGYNRPNLNQQQFHQQQEDVGYDLNDAMLPSSLNDLFTPRELQVRRVRQQETNESSLPYPMSYSPSRTNSSFDTCRDVTHQQWRVPFLTKSSQNEMMAMANFDFDDSNRCTAAINIPGGGSSSSGTGSSGSYLLQQEDLLLGGMSQLQIQDDEVQFFMEDDEAVTYESSKDHKTLDLTNNTTTTTSASTNNNTNTTPYTFPPLISLPSI